MRRRESERREEKVRRWRREGEKREEGGGEEEKRNREGRNIDDNRSILYLQEYQGSAALVGAIVGECPEGDRRVLGAHGECSRRICRGGAL